jgi:acetyl-CoA carboxylase alpha subunit
MIGGLGKIGDQSFMIIGQQRATILKQDNIETLEWLILRDIVKHYA